MFALLLPVVYITAHIHFSRIYMFPVRPDFYNATSLFRCNPENKTQGFDVQDIRLGGLMRRMTICKEMLEDFVAGKIDRITDLEEKQIEIIHKKELVNEWSRTVTANVLSRLA